MFTHIERVEAAIKKLREGKMVILTDREDRENEGDLILAAETITDADMNFMIRNGTGIICLPMSRELLKHLDLPLMVTTEKNDSTHRTPFTVSIDAKHGISTGVSAHDRVVTVLKAIDPNTTADDLVKPGHMYPLEVTDGGVLKRQGHTEGSTDLVALAGFKKAAVITEIMNPDGTMATGDQLVAFAEAHDLCMLSIDDIIAYRLLHEDMITEEATAALPLEKYGQFQITIVKEQLSQDEQIVLFKAPVDKLQPPLLRIHSACSTGDLFASNRCDCHQQLHYSLERISQEGGMLIYLQQEGRGIGLFNKIKAYALQENGLDTVEANEKLGLPIDARQYAIAANILRNRHIHRVRLLTNNPIKIRDLIKYGIKEVIQEQMPSFQNEFNQHYLATKKDKLNHNINFDFISQLARVSE